MQVFDRVLPVGYAAEIPEITPKRPTLKTIIKPLASRLYALLNCGRMFKGGAYAPSVIMSEVTSACSLFLRSGSVAHDGLADLHPDQGLVGDVHDERLHGCADGKCGFHDFRYPYPHRAQSSQTCQCQLKSEQAVSLLPFELSVSNSTGKSEVQSARRMPSPRRLRAL